MNQRSLGEAAAYAAEQFERLIDAYAEAEVGWVLHDETPKVAFCARGGSMSEQLCECGHSLADHPAPALTCHAEGGFCPCTWFQAADKQDQTP